LAEYGIVPRLNFERSLQRLIGSTKLAPQFRNTRQMGQGVDIVRMAFHGDRGFGQRSIKLTVAREQITQPNTKPRDPWLEVNSTPLCDQGGFEIALLRYQICQMHEAIWVPRLQVRRFRGRQDRLIVATLVTQNGTDFVAQMCIARIEFGGPSKCDFGGRNVSSQMKDVTQMTIGLGAARFIDGGDIGFVQRIRTIASAQK
jgi:hypothetical protein